MFPTFWQQEENKYFYSCGNIDFPGKVGEFLQGIFEKIPSLFGKIFQ
jgi:hypothetical protein